MRQKPTEDELNQACLQGQLSDRQTRRMLEFVMNSIQARIFWKDLDSVFLGCNRHFALDAGYSSPDEIVGKDDLDMPWKDQADLYRTDDRSVMESGIPKLNYEEPQTNPQGKISWLRTSKIPLRDESGKIIGVLGTYEDITQQKLADELLRKTNRLLRLLSGTNQILIRATNESAMMRDACNLAVEIGGYSMVWIGFAQDDEEKTVFPVCISGNDDGYLEAVRIRWSDTELGRGPIGTAIRTGRPVAVDDLLVDTSFSPWKKEAAKRGYASVIAVPLSSDGRVIGSINLYSSKPGPVESEEIDILAEMADDLSYGMTVIRTRDDRTKAVDALGRSEEKYRDLVQNANSIILRWNTDGTISFFNEFAQSFFGYKESEIIGKSVIGTIVPEKESSGRDLVGLINRIVGHPTRYKTNINENMRKNGERVWVAWTNKPVFDEHGHVKELLSVGLDVTELTAARHALEQSEERYKSVFDSNAAGFVLFDLEGNIVDANPKACVLYGYACEDLIGRNCRSFVDTEYYSVFDHFLETPLGQWYNAQFVNVRRDGTKFQTEVFGTRLLFGSQERFLAIIQDITELKRVEEEKKKFYRKTIESATEGKLVISDEGDIRSIVGAPIVQCDITSAGHLAGFRSLVAREAESAGMSPDRIYDIVLCAGEASTNVIKHAGHGKASIHRVGDRLIVVVSDEGPGIEAVNFPEVALKKGYTTAVSLGMGFKAMISIADRVYLATGSGGTTVGIEMRVNRREGKQPTINVPDTW